LGVHEFQSIDIDSGGAGNIANTEMVETVKGVWAQLDSCADFAELGSLLEDDGRDAFLGQRRGRCEPTDP